MPVAALMVGRDLYRPISDGDLIPFDDVLYERHRLRRAVGPVTSQPPTEKSNGATNRTGGMVHGCCGGKHCDCYEDGENWRRHRKTSRRPHL